MTTQSCFLSSHPISVTDCLPFDDSQLFYWMIQTCHDSIQLNVGVCVASRRWVCWESECTCRSSDANSQGCFSSGCSRIPGSCMYRLVNPVHDTSPLSRWDPLGKSKDVPRKRMLSQARRQTKLHLEHVTFGRLTCFTTFEKHRYRGAAVVLAHLPFSLQKPKGAKSFVLLVKMLLSLSWSFPTSYINLAVLCWVFFDSHFILLIAFSLQRVPKDNLSKLLTT